MAREVYSITSSALPESARVAAFHGTEGISRTYEFDVYILLGAEGNDLDLDDVVGAKAKLALDRADSRPPFLFHGIFAAFELVHEFADRSLFHAVLVPQLWQLKQTFHSRMWTNKSITDVIKEVLEDSGLSGGDYQLKLSASYPVLEHICQYKESNFDFISRWMERDGMYFYFEQGEDSEKLIISDSKGYEVPLDPHPVRFFAAGGHDFSAGEALHTFKCQHRALPASVKLKDYDYAKPTLDVSGSAPVSKVGFGEISVYGSRFFTPDDGKRLAKLRAEELLARKAIYRGTGTEFHLRAGYRFTLEDHPRSAFDQQYLAIAVEHTGTENHSDGWLRELTGIDSDKVYWVEVTAIPASVQFRAESATAWPRVYGFENGTVCGPAESEYAQIDEQGRYNVKFKFDESDLKNGKASTWVRMMQPHGGSPEGFHFPLRKGTEVVFTFLGGDPDRPVLTGVVPDTTNPSLITSGNHTRNVLQTGGYNRLEIEDLAGQQRVTLSTPHAKTHLLMGNPLAGHEFIARTEGNSLHHTDINHDQYVGANCAIAIVSNQTETIGATKTQTVTGDVKHTHEANHTHLTQGDHQHTTKGDHTHLTQGDHQHTTQGDLKETTDGDHTKETEGDTKITLGGSWHNVVSGFTDWKFEAAKNETVMGAANNKFIGVKMEWIGGMYMETVVGVSIELKLAACLDTTIGAKLEIVVGPRMLIASCAEHEIAPDSSETKALKSALHGIDESLVGLRKQTVGLHNIMAGGKKAAHGMKQYTVGLDMVNAGIKNTEAGLHAME
jgi:type VI secretion system secreted protein VgrG